MQIVTLLRQDLLKMIDLYAISGPGYLADRSLKLTDNLSEIRIYHYTNSICSLTVFFSNILKMECHHVYMFLYKGNSRGVLLHTIDISYN